MSFPHLPQRKFYQEYAIKQQQEMNEDNLNTMPRRIKKELDHTYNILMILMGQHPIEWTDVDYYEVGEIVGYGDSFYVCLIEHSGRNPSLYNNYWQLFDVRMLSERHNFDNVLLKDNQTPYEPSTKKLGEATADFHPATKLYVDNKVNNAFDNKTAVNSLRLEGKSLDDFILKDDISGVVLKDDIVDDLTSIDHDKPLSANAGKTLYEYIRRIQDLININDTDFASIADMIAVIKSNKSILDGLTIDNILGLRALLNGIQGRLEEFTPKIWWTGEQFLKRIMEVDGHGSKVDADLLDGVEGDGYLKKVDFTNGVALNLIKTIDGPGSGIEADLLDGYHGSDFLRRTASDRPSSDNTFDLGSSSYKWRNIYATNFQGTALQAKYADLAEKYETDKDYDYGTVLGINENGISEYQPGMNLIGVVSENPGLIINKDSDGVLVALKGRIKVKVHGDIKIKRGDFVLAYKDGKATGSSTMTFDKLMRKIGVALSDTKDGYVEVKV